MVFSSTIFLFYFLPALIVLYFVVPKQFKNILLLTASLLFYAWGEGFYVVLMLISITVNYFFGRMIDANESSKKFLICGITINLGILISYKYSNFIADNIDFVLSYAHLPNIDLAPVHLPLGISFFTFQAISYLIDISRKEIPSQKNFINLGLYISLFPQLIAGPIVRYKTIIKEIDDREISSSLFASGVERFIYGLAKKMLIANPLGLVVDVIFELPLSETPAHIAWVGIIFYALQIYFDFSGYSDMAIGLGRMFGFRFLENFNYPYVSKSLQEFWRRWHISLSSWFRDYLYIPLGGNRKSPFRTYCNLFTIFLLCGLWHGASWNFFVWGLFHGLVLTIERLGLGSILNQLWQPIRHFYLIIVVLVSWVFFRAETLSGAVDYLNVMFSFDFGHIPFEFLESINLDVLVATIAGLILCFATFRRFIEKDISVQGDHAVLYPIAKAFLLLTLLLLSTMKLASSTHNPFIYFRF